MSAKETTDGLLNETDHILAMTVKHEELDISPLPESTIPLALPEAEEHYLSINPPFLRSRMLRKPPGTLRRARLAIDGSLAKPDIEVNLISRAWKETGDYWTLDLNGQRSIIKGFSGGRGGVCYRRWDGMENGFAEKAIAYAPRKQPEDESVGLGEESSSKLADDGEISQHSPVRRQSARHEEKEFVLDWGSRSVSSSSSSHGSSSPGMLDIETPRSAEPLPLTRPGDPKVGLAEESSPRLAGDGEIRPHLPVQQQSTRDTNGRFVPNWGSVQKLPKRRRRATNKSPGPENSNPPTRSSAKRQRSGKNVRNGVNQRDQLHAPPPASTSVSFPAVSEHRQNNTILYVFFNSETDSVPLKLRNMMTMPTFFASVLEAFDLQGHEDEVRALRITFDALPTCERESSWLMKRNIPATFERFLEVLNGLPVWETEGKCSIEVRILMRES